MVIQPKRRRTITLTIRTDEQVFKALVKEADTKKVTVNAYVNQILTGHVAWGRHASKYGWIQIPIEGWASVLNLLDDDTIAKYGKESAHRRWKSLITIWHGDTTPETVLKFVTFWLENTGQARVIFEEEARPRRVVGFHDLGRKGSLLFKNAIETLFELAHKKVIVDIQDNQFSFKFD